MILPDLAGRSRGIRLFILAPPYHEFVPLSQLSMKEVPDGSLLVLDVTAAERPWANLTHVVPALRARMPVLPVVLRASASHELVHLAGRATKLHVRAVLSPGDGVESTLRTVLCEPVDLAGDVMEWLALRGVRFGITLVRPVRDIFDQALEHADAGALLRAGGYAPTTVRHALAKKGLPGPGRWFQLARAIRLAVHLQSSTTTSLVHIARQTGFADQTAVCQLIRRSFDLRAGQVRQTLGWEWLMERWLVLQVFGRETSTCDQNDERGPIRPIVGAVFPL